MWHAPPSFLLPPILPPANKPTERRFSIFFRESEVLPRKPFGCGLAIEDRLSKLFRQMPGGRPKNPETLKKFDEALQLVSNGMGIQKACEKVGVSKTRFFVDLKTNEELREKYARAREEQADYLADEIVQIADETDDPHKARLQIDARKWTASKLRPKRYGDKIDHSVEVSGSVEVVIGGEDDG